MKRLFVIMLSLLLITSCQKNVDTKSGQNLTKIDVLLDWTPNTNHTGLYVALHKGYYKEKGLDVNIIQPAEDTVIDIVSSNKAQFGISFQEYVSMARAANTPQDVVAVAAVIAHNTSGFAARTSSGINKVSDFEGKRYSGSDSPWEKAVLKKIMETENADANKVQYMADFSLDFFAATEKNVDFSWIYYAWDGIAAEVKNIPLNYFPLIDYGLDFYTPVIITSQKFIDQNPQAVKDFLEATSRGYNDCIKNPKECAEILLKYAPELDRELVIKSQEYLKNEYISDSAYWGEMKREMWENLGDFLYENGVIPVPLDVDKAFTNEFLPK